MKLKKLFVLHTILFITLMMSGCGFLGGIYDSFVSAVGTNDTGTVIANKAQIRTSFAVVATDLLEVKRGDKLDIIDQVEFEKSIWYRVRARDEDQTEGWIEAQNIITGELLEKSRNIAEEDKNLPAQATGMLRNKSNLRLTPEQRDDNIILKLDNNSTFEIVTWKYVPKAQDAPDVDNNTKGDNSQTKKKTKNEELEAAKEANEPDKMDEKYDTWYKVRIDSSVSPAAGGWLFGRQVEIQLPGDIAFFQANNKKFVSWVRIDSEAVSKDPSKNVNPGSYVILTRTNISKPINGVEPDFDGILVLVFDKYDQAHYTAYRTSIGSEVWGQLPMKMEGTGDNKTFTVRLRSNTTGEVTDVRFVIFKDKNRVKITPPADISSFEKKETR